MRQRVFSKAKMGVAEPAIGVLVSQRPGQVALGSLAVARILAGLVQPQQAPGGAHIVSVNDIQRGELAPGAIWILNLDQPIPGASGGFEEIRALGFFIHSHQAVNDLPGIEDQRRSLPIRPQRADGESAPIQLQGQQPVCHAHGAGAVGIVPAVGGIIKKGGNDITGCLGVRRPPGPSPHIVESRHASRWHGILGGAQPGHGRSQVFRVRAGGIITFEQVMRDSRKHGAVASLAPGPYTISNTLIYQRTE